MKFVGVDLHKKTISICVCDQARNILDRAKQALESGSATECTDALEKIAEMGRILSEVILYDPGSFSSAGKTEGETEEA